MDLVKDFMTRTLNSVCENDSLEYTIRAMYKSEMSVLPVVNEMNKFLGTIYSENILKNIIPEKYGYLDSNSLLYEINQAAENIGGIKDRPVQEYMSTRISVIEEDDRMYRVADLMLDNKESILFVVNEQGNLRGYISRADLLFFLLQMSGVS